MLSKILLYVNAYLDKIILILKTMMITVMNKNNKGINVKRASFK